jgi:predicted DsbA family dithiol-disulfide isomerase
MAADVVCPWCYVGLQSLFMALDALARDFEVALRFRPYQLNPDTPLEGVDREAYYRARFPDAERRAAVRAHLVEAAKTAGAAFDPSVPKRLPNTLAAHRALRIASSEGAAEPYARALYETYWRDGADIGAPAVLADVAAAAGLDRADFLGRLERGDKQAETSADAAAMRAAGVTGVPTFIVNERRGFSGALPPKDLEGAIRRAADISMEAHA